MPLSDSQKNWLGKSAMRYHEDMTPEILSYLEGRGIGPDAVDGHLLGVVDRPDPLHEPFRGRLSIPFITPTGIVHMRFRCLEEHDCGKEGHGKYEGPAGEETHLYNVRALHEAETVVAISEGELDAVVASLAGLPTTGVPGAKAWKRFYYRLFDDFERVLILGDGDTAGRKFASTLASTIPNGEARVLPDGHDVTSFVQAEGVEAFKSFVLA